MPSKMRPLATTQLMMTWLSMCPADESTTPRQKFGQIAYTSTILIVNLINFTASMTYCLKLFTIDFDGAAFGFMAAIGEFGLIYFLFSAIRMRQQIGDIFTSLSAIYKSNENEIFCIWYLARANNTCQWMWRFYFKYIAVTLVGVIANSLLSVLNCYFIEDDFNSDHLYRPGKYVLPWNQSTPLGYLAEMMVTIACSYGYLFLNGTPLLLFISLCIHHQAFYKMFKHSIDKAEKCDAKLLCDLIRFHISIKNWFLDSANVYSSFVLVQLLCSAVLMTITVFYLDLQWQHFDFIVASVISNTIIGMSTLLFYCYFGKLATENYEKMPDCVYNMNWYEQPNALQRYLILMITNMDKPMYYHGFEVAKLNMETFVKLFKSVLSYYIAIKTMASK